MQWRVGNGRSIDACAESWILKNGSLKPFTPSLLHANSLLVSHFIDASTGSWNLTALGQHFWDVDVDDIIQIPLPRIDLDVWIWHYAKHGHYTMSTAYYLARDIKEMEQRNRNGSASIGAVCNLNWIWNIKLPNKTKKILLCLVKHSLPVLTALRRRGVNVELLCPVCKSYDETLIHIL